CTDGKRKKWAKKYSSRSSIQAVANETARRRSGWFLTRRPQGRRIYRPIPAGSARVYFKRRRRGACTEERTMVRQVTTGAGLFIVQAVLGIGVWFLLPGVAPLFPAGPDEVAYG